MLITVNVGLIPTCITSIILPRFGYFNLDTLGAISEILWIPIITYSIIRYGQMNVKAVFTEVLAIAMAGIFFINIFIDTPFGIWGRIGAFVAFLILAYFLIRGVLLEARQRDLLDTLNRTLEDKVAEQTREIRRSYEAERTARLELEKLNDAKDQFIMITQHHLRTPLNGINWALESTLAGDHGPVTNELRPIVEEMQRGGKRLMKIVDDFLNITAIKVGTNILDLGSHSLLGAVEDCLAELSGPIAEKHLRVSLSKERAQWPTLHIDEGKLRESLFIILENAVKYNNDGGRIDIGTQVAGETFTLAVTNTGIGITEDEATKIGSSLFYRGQAARENNPIGMGIGLSVVKAIVKAHKGTFSIVSKGKNEGARVVISFQVK